MDEDARLQTIDPTRLRRMVNAGIAGTLTAIAARARLETIPVRGSNHYLLLGSNGVWRKRNDRSLNRRVRPITTKKICCRNCGQIRHRAASTLVTTVLRGRL